jgi:ferrochelatase
VKKIAVILFNLGGPDGLESIQPFLFNLFYDPAIIRLPNPFRFLIAKFASYRRLAKAREIYGEIGGRSPILENTRNQARQLEKMLHETSYDPQYKIFIAMRYWHPFADEAARAVDEYKPDEIVLLPLYPQFSTTTTQSSIIDWLRAAKKEGLKVPTKTLDGFSQEKGFISSLSKATLCAYEEAKTFGKPRILFSAHGLPEIIALSGDPYQLQCEQTADAIRQELQIDNLDSVLCYQSRVGPLRWISPSTDNEIRRVGRDKVPIILVPISFVCEQAETLVEMDKEYSSLAHQSGVPFFYRVPASGTSPDFIFGLVQLLRDIRSKDK